jgi:SAM-dependent methyltransferase
VSDEFELEILATMPNYYGWIMETFAPFVRGHVVEYGAGTGTISQRLGSLADKLTLVEPSAKLAAVLRTKFRGDPKVEVIHQSLQQHVATMGDAAVDTVVMVNVLEHIEDDRQALALLLGMLRPTGHLLIFVPALQGLMSRLDVMFGHFRRYRRHELVAKVNGVGGEAEVCRYFDFAGIFPWLFLNKLMGASTFNRRLIEIHDKFVVPVSRAVERVVPPPIGKNVILVARKSRATFARIEA